MPEHGRRDQSAQSQPRGRGGQRRQQCPPFGDALDRPPGRLGKPMVAYPRRVQARGLGVMRHRPDLRPGRHPAGPVRDGRRHHHPDPHANTITLVSRPGRAEDLNQSDGAARHSGRNWWRKTALTSGQPRLRATHADEDVWIWFAACAGTCG